MTVAELIKWLQKTQNKSAEVCVDGVPIEKIEELHECFGWAWHDDGVSIVNLTPFKEKKRP